MKHILFSRLDKVVDEISRYFILATFVADIHALLARGDSMRNSGDVTRDPPIKIHHLNSVAIVVRHC